MVVMQPARQPSTHLPDDLPTNPRTLHPPTLHPSTILSEVPAFWKDSCLHLSYFVNYEVSSLKVALSDLRVVPRG